MIFTQSRGSDRARPPVVGPGRSPRRDRREHPARRAAGKRRSIVEERYEHGLLPPPGSNIGRVRTGFSGKLVPVDDHSPLMMVWIDRKFFADWRSRSGE